ncbi:hypothetical protein PHMEG_00026415 [Phytophthora megakarya]|uniref:Eukaryotic/viral aspartic protease n=1 Tax=Phytophthora megakarya TaxID=4795 RepID=A0A225V8I5_9STRA|nr:hypothetical protein PHMEG_00026415 [Phytophthora megakarya]
MAEGALVSNSSSPAPTSGAVLVPAVPASEAAVVPDRRTDPAPGNTPSADTNPVDSADSGAVVPTATTPANTSSGVLPPANFLTPAEVEEMSLADVISGLPTLADTGMALAPVSWDAPPAYDGLTFIRLAYLHRSPHYKAAPRGRSIAGQRELAALLGQFPLDRLAERMINSLSFIRRLLAKIRHLQAASAAESNGTLSSETLVTRDNFDVMRREWAAMCRHWGQRVRALKQDQLTDQVAQLQAQLRDSEAARQAAERRAAERVLDVNALVDFLMGNKLKINVMFNWMRLAALLHHFAEGTTIPEGTFLTLGVWQRLVALLPAGMLWTDVREDVQHLLLSGMNFKRAMKWVSESQVIHHLEPREAVCRMLAQVIHAGQLDQTPWCRFVPEGFYTSAEGTLRLRQAKREPTPPWHPLGRCFIKVQKRKQSTRETEALQPKLPGSSDDEIQDPSYELSQAELGKAVRGEAAADNDKSSEDSDEAEKESKPAVTDLSPASCGEAESVKIL